MNFGLLIFVAALCASCIANTLPNDPQTLSNKNNQAELNKPKTDSNQPEASNPTDTQASAASNADSPAKEADNQPPKTSLKPRCAQCNKKVLLIIKCHCEKVFCSKHRHAEEHNCTYDFKTEGQKKLAEQNQPVVASKLNGL